VDILSRIAHRGRRVETAFVSSPAFENPQSSLGGFVSTAKVDSIELYYEVHGAGEPLLLIMGLAADSVAWLFQLPEFSRHCRTVIFDNRGVGRSAKPAGPYTIPQMADDTAGLLAALDIDRAHVVGVSMGGMIAQELALRHPQRVRCLVLACTYARADEEIARMRESSVQQLGGRIDARGEIQIDIGQLDPLSFFQMLLPSVFNQSFIETELPKLMEVFAGSLQYGFSMEAILGQVSAVMHHDTLARLPQITSPTLVITGDADRLIPPAHSDVLAQRIPGAKLVKVPGGSHGFNFETPDVFNREVLSFLASSAA
jgi:3-oxoadipate enol-lactonase